MAPPLDFRARSAFGARRVGLEAGRSKSSAIPSRRFSRPQGVDPHLTVPPCCRWLTLFGFSLQSFLPPRSSRALVALACPSRRFSPAGAVPVAWSCCLPKLRPQGFSESRKRFPRSRTGEGLQQRPMLSWSFLVAFVVFPSLVSAHVSEPSAPGLSCVARASSRAQWTFSVFLPAPWRLGP
jgi:hypothetical protein